MATDDIYLFTGFSQGYAPVVGDIFAWQRDGEEGPAIDPFFELTEFTDGTPDTFLATQLSNGDLPESGNDMFADYADDGGYGGSTNEWLLSLTLDPELQETEAPVIRMIDFTYNKSTAYACEFRDQQIRFYYDSTVLLDGASEVFITSPYLEADLFELFYKQINDTMWIVHEDYQPRKLTRTSATTFSLDVINFNRGPFLLRNDLIDLDPVSSASMTFNNGTLTCDGDIFASGHVGAIFQLTHPVPDRIIEQSGTGISDTIYAKGKVEFLTRGNWTGKVALEKNVNRAGWEKIGVYKSNVNAYQNIRLTHIEEEINVQFRINASEASSTFLGEITPAEGLQKGIVKITAVTDASNASAYTIAPLASTESTKRWAEGAWSAYRTWPSSVTFYQGRCVYGGKRVIPAQILQGIEGGE